MKKVTTIESYDHRGDLVSKKIITEDIYEQSGTEVSNLSTEDYDSILKEFARRFSKSVTDAIYK